MRLGDIETHLATALGGALNTLALVRQGPPVLRPTSGMQGEVFLHAARFLDLGGVTADGARVTRRALDSAPGLCGVAEERPARIEVELTFLSPVYNGLLDLCDQTTPALLTALETLPPPLLAGEAGGSVELRFADSRAVLASSETWHRESACGAWYEAKMVVRLEGFLHIHLTRPDGSALRVRVAYDPSGADLGGEHVLLTNDTRLPMSLGGYVLLDAARRPHRYVFPPYLLPPAGSVKVWTGRGVNDGGNLYWGRRQAVWTNSGDSLRLLDTKGTDLAALSWSAPTEASTPPHRPSPRNSRKPRT